MPGRLFRYALFSLLLSLLLGVLAACSSNGNGDPEAPRGADNGDVTRDEDDGKEPDGDDAGPGGDSDGDDGNGDIVSSGDGGCSVRVTGDIEAEWEGPDESVVTDYWLTEEEKRQILEIFGRIGSDLDDDEVEATAEAALASGEPVLGLMLMNCEGDGNELISFFAPNDATPEMFPFGPGEYVIGTGGFLDGGESGEVSILFTLEEDALFGVQNEGTFIIERWDTSRMEGTFAFTAEESFVFEDEPRVIQVEGEFSFTCQDSQICG